MIDLASINSILLDIIAERHRQERLKAEGKFAWSLADAYPGVTPSDRFVVLGEEFGEVGMVISDYLGRPKEGIDTEHLREELIQLAACCVAWVEHIDAVTDLPALITPYTDAETEARAAALPPPRGIATLIADYYQGLD